MVAVFSARAVDGHQGLAGSTGSGWEGLDGSGAGRRDLCLDAVGDVLAAGLLTRDDAERVVERLVTVALSDESLAA